MGGDALPYSQGLGLLALTLAVYYAPPLERTPLHQTRVEVLFWPLAYAFGAYIHLCLPTSPLIAVGIAPERPFAAAMVGFAAIFGAATQQRRRRERLKSMAARIDLDQGLALTPSVRARVATLRIRDLLQQRAGLLHGLLEPFLTGTRSDLCDALTEVAKGGPADLVSLIHSTEVDLGVLIQHGQEGVAKILRQSVQIMGVTEKATLIDALQRQESDFRANEELQDCALDALRSTHGAELLRLKNLLDSGGDVFSLHRLVYLDMSEEKRRVALAHFQREAAVWAQARFIKGMPAESLYPERSSTGRDAGAVAGLRTARKPIKILSDIDDTLFSSGGHFPAGCDRRIPRHEYYPGLLQLFREVEAGATAAGATPDADSNASHRTPEKKAKEGRASEQEVTLWVRERCAGQTRHEASGWEERVFPADSPLSSLAARLLTTGGTAHVAFARPPSVGEASPIAFLSARPHAYKDYTEAASYRTFRLLHSRGQISCVPTLLAGELRSSMGSMLLAIGEMLSRAAKSTPSAAWASVGHAKAKTFAEYTRLYPECDYVLFGDNGQGDLLCAELLHKRASDPALAGDAASPISAPRTSFMQLVKPVEQQLSDLPAGTETGERQKRWRDARICFNHTYAGAACDAQQHGLISMEGLSRVASTARKDLDRMQIEYRDSSQDWSRRVEELNADLRKCNAVLPFELAVAELKPRGTASLTSGSSTVHLALHR